MAATLYTLRVQGFTNAGALGTATGTIGQANLVQIEVLDNNTIRFTDAVGIKHTLDLSKRSLSKFFKRILTGAAGVPAGRTWSD